MEFFYYDNQDNTIKAICTLHNSFFFIYLLFYLLLLGINFWYIIAKTISLNLPISRKFEYLILKCSKSVFFSTWDQWNKWHIIMFLISTLACVGKVVVAAFIKES